MTRATNSLIGRRSARPPAVLMNGATRFRPHPYCGERLMCGGAVPVVRDSLFSNYLKTTLLHVIASRSAASQPV